MEYKIRVMIACPSCGYLNSEKEAFCRKCRANLHLSATRYIHPEEYEHPLDRDAQNFIESTIFLPAIYKLVANFQASINKAIYQAHFIKVTPKSYSRIYRLAVECAKKLSLPKLPEIYIEGASLWNAFAIGTDENPIVVITSQAVNGLSDEELMHLLGHEFAHIKSNHLVYTSALLTLGGIATDLVSMKWGILPAEVLSGALKLALLKWYRASEFTCDRAGLICTGDLSTAENALLKMHMQTEEIEDIDIDSLLSQIKEKLSWNLIVKLKELSETHPFFGYRVLETRKFYHSDQYKTIIEKLEMEETGQVIPLFVNHVYAGGFFFRKGTWLEKTFIPPKKLKNANMEFRARSINDPWPERHITLQLNNHIILDNEKIQTKTGVQWRGDVTMMLLPGVPNKFKLHIDSAGFRWSVTTLITFEN